MTTTAHTACGLHLDVERERSRTDLMTEGDVA
jgi:hypothetical protein